MKARENPFRVERQHGLPFHFTQGNTASLIDSFDALDRRAAIIGPHGSGKTTLLEELIIQLRQTGRQVEGMRLSSAGRSRASHDIAGWMESIPNDAILVLDGAEQLNWRTWKSFSSASERYGGLLITSHQAGRLPTLYHCQTSLELLQELVAELAPPDARPAPAELHSLFKRCSGNIRDCLRQLYDDWSSDKTIP